MVKRTVCEKNRCCGCKACKCACPKDAIEIFDRVQYFEAVIDNDRCINCDRCKKVCPNETASILLEPIKWFQGWARSEEIRESSSSGGFARVISEYFVLHGGTVCSCVYEKGQFGFEMIDSVESLSRFSGSKYVKSDVGECYESIRKKLRQDEKVLFIGLPCQVAAVKNYVGDRYWDNLYTVDLICHGTPSVNLLRMYFSEKNISLANVKKISFRQKDKFAIGGSVSFTPYGIMDRYSVAFLAGICYTENCYQCKYANRKRVADITIGDSWGSELTDQINKGISLIACQTEKGLKILEMLDFEYLPVNVEKAIASNHQLNAPSKRPAFLDAFYKDLNDGKNFSDTVFKYCKVKCLKQITKQILVKYHLMKIRGGYRLSYKIDTCNSIIFKNQGGNKNV